MFFGEIKTELSEGALLSSSFILYDEINNIKISKGTKIDKKIIKLLLKNNINQVMCAKLDKEDVDENTSAKLISKALIDKSSPTMSISNPGQGRCNIVAEINGLLKYNPNKLYKINAINNDVGIAALKPLRIVKKKQIIATTKIIPFAINKLIIERIQKHSEHCFEILPFLNRKVHLIQTHNEKTLKKVLDKTLLVTERRLLECQITSLIEKRCAHNVNNLSEKINESVKENADIILVFGASAICDKNDIVPLSLKKNNGKIIRLGMPVEPGNLMLLGKIDHNNKIIFVLGMPGCARSQKENGVDWILWRLLCGLDISNRDINDMGTGGLL
ncbi:hypothetical protein OAD02_02645 [Alphaproteobacteria bacterium]|nr:hypothetical protein [Alphaproteobacteria bacterium]